MAFAVTSLHCVRAITFVIPPKVPSRNAHFYAPEETLHSIALPNWREEGRGLLDRIEGGLPTGAWITGDGAWKPFAHAPLNRPLLRVSWPR